MLRCLRSVTAETEVLSVEHLRGKVYDYVNPLAIQINVPVVCKHEDQFLWLFRECSRFNPIGDVIVRLGTDSFFPIG